MGMGVDLHKLVHGIKKSPNRVLGGQICDRRQAKSTRYQGSRRLIWFTPFPRSYPLLHDNGFSGCERVIGLVKLGLLVGIVRDRADKVGSRRQGRWDGDGRA